jgi:hypothetical protein
MYTSALVLTTESVGGVSLISCWRTGGIKSRIQAALSSKIFWSLIGAWLLVFVAGVVGILSKSWAVQINAVLAGLLGVGAIIAALRANVREADIEAKRPNESSRAHDRSDE